MAETREGPWSILDDGVWKRVSFLSGSQFQMRAEVLVKQLQESVCPTDLLQNLLLDRIVTSWIRKKVLLEVQAERQGKNRSEEASRGIPATDGMIGNYSLDRPWSSNMLKYEALLDQGFHRDLVLLLEMKKAASAAPASSFKKPPQSERGLLEGRTDSNVADQAVGSSAVPMPSPNASGSEAEESGIEKSDFGRVDLE